MNRKAFLLGLYSIGGQTLLLREMVASLNGDELFIGTALFGWLLAVAFGASIGGMKKTNIGARTLFVAGAMILPLSIIAVRLSPLLVSSVVGERIPFITASAISIVLMFPVGFTSGLLFPVISREGYRISESIVKVYLFEGIGAFIGGISVMVLVGWIISNFMAAALLGLIVIVFAFFSHIEERRVLPILIMMAGAAFVRYYVPVIDRAAERAKFRPYLVQSSFDTHYGHQTIISRDSTVSLISDNLVEATTPDLLAAENVLLPPLLINPRAEDVLLIGRAEFGIMQLAAQIPDLKISALDSRKSLSEHTDRLIRLTGNIARIDDDPIRFLSGQASFKKYDVIIVNAGDPDSYKNNRYLTKEFLNKLRILLKDNGIVSYPSHYGTDRYISREKAELLSVIYKTFKKAFTYVAVWPGDMTLFFASDDSTIMNTTLDSLVSHTGELGYRPQYLNEDYLSDRLESIKTQRLDMALHSGANVNSLNRPRLLLQQSIYSSEMGSLDRRVVPLLLEKPLWLFMIPLLLLIYFTAALSSKRRQRIFGLWLYFVAGLVSLTLELISFYVYQSSAGSLYSEIGALIGAFMLGLALGTYFSSRAFEGHLEILSLLLFLTTVVIFLVTFNSVRPYAAIYYHILFLLTAAIATGTLFVAATNRYYFGRSESNRGKGYAYEIIGSSLGALLTTSLLIPVIGLPWLLISIIFLLAVSLIGAWTTA